MTAVGAMAAATLALLSTTSYAETSTKQSYSARLPIAMLGSWCSINWEMEIYYRSTEQGAKCMMLEANKIEYMEDLCKFLNIRREGNSFVVRMVCEGQGDCDYSSRRKRIDCSRNRRPVLTSIFRLDGDRLRIREKK